MKIPRLLVLPLACLPALLRADPVSSHVSAATVYADRAFVTRSAGTDVVDGENVLEFDHLPAGLDDRSLQFSAHGSVPATILDVSAEEKFVDTAPSARVKDLDDQVETLQKKIRVLDDRLAVLNGEKDFVRRMLVSSTPTAPARNGDATHAPDSPLEEWEKLLTYSDDTLGKVDSAVRTAEDEKTDLVAQRSALEQQANSLRSGRKRTVKNVRVRVSVAAAGHLDAELRYLVNGASWAPAYDARLHTADRAVELSYEGLVRNGTGEDWNNVALTLSTARPSLGGEAPELSPWWVYVEEPTVLTSFSVNATLAGTRRTRSLGAGSPAPSSMDLEKADAEDKELSAFEVAAEVTSAATSATFKIVAPVTVAANGSVQKVAIVETRLPATLSYEATPKLLEAAFLSAAVANGTDYPFLGGPMNTFLDDTFVAASHLKTVMPGEKFELHLGADEGIAVKRKLVNRFAENTGITGGGRRVTYEFLLTFTNHKRTEEQLTFKEPLPVSRQEKIVVKLLTPESGDLGTKDSPKEVTQEEAGTLVWHLDLKPGEKREIPLKFSVSYPSELNVSGLE